jgi:hypothetical protein
MFMTPMNTQAQRSPQLYSATAAKSCRGRTATGARSMNDTKTALYSAGM